MRLSEVEDYCIWRVFARPDGVMLIATRLLVAAGLFIAKSIEAYDFARRVFFGNGNLSVEIIF